MSCPRSEGGSVVARSPPVGWTATQVPGPSVRLYQNAPYKFRYTFRRLINQTDIPGACSGSLTGLKPPPQGVHPPMMDCPPSISENVLQLRFFQKKFCYSKLVTFPLFSQNVDISRVFLEKFTFPHIFFKTIHFPSIFVQFTCFYFIYVSVASTIFGP